MESKTPEKTIGSRISSVIGLILCIILIPLLIINLTIIVKSFAYPDKVPNFMGFKPLIVLSNSMNPSIEMGDIVLDKMVDTDALQVGDIISFRQGPTTVITHRIKEIKVAANGTKEFITQGDANNTPDQDPVPVDSVEGKVLTNVHRIGNAALFMQSRAGMLIFIVVPLLLLVLFDIFRRRKQNYNDKMETAELEKELDRVKNMLAEKERTGDTEKDDMAKGKKEDWDLKDKK